MKSALVIGSLEGVAISGCFRCDGFILFSLMKNEKKAEIVHHKLLMNR